MNTQDKLCMKCGHHIKIDVNFCSHCGSTQETFLNCSSCNRKLAIDAKFCNSCGTHVVANSTPEDTADSVATKKRKPFWNGWRRTWITISLAWVAFVAKGDLSSCMDRVLELKELIFAGAIFPIALYILGKIVGWVILGPKKK